MANKNFVKIYFFEFQPFISLQIDRLWSEATSNDQSRTFISKIFEVAAIGGTFCDLILVKEILFFNLSRMATFVTQYVKNNYDITKLSYPCLLRNITNPCILPMCKSKMTQ